MPKIQLSDIKSQSTTRYTGKINIPLLDSLMDNYDADSDRQLQSIYLKLADGDSHLNSEFAKRVNAVSGLDYGFEDDESGKLWEMFNELINFNQLVSYMQQAVLHGYSAIQLIWAKDGGTLMLDDIKLRPNYLFNRTIDDDITIWRGAGEVQLEKLDMQQWVLHKHNYAAPIPYLNGVIRTLARNLVYKRIAMADKDRFLATYGIPIKVGHYPVGSSEEQQDLFLKFLSNMTTNASGCLPEGFEVEIVQGNSGNSTPFESTIEYIDGQIDAAINGGTLSSVSSNVGSRALGEVLDKGRLELINDDARQIISTINRQLLPLIFDKSMGLKTPKLILRTKTEQAADVDLKPIPATADKGDE